VPAALAFLDIFENAVTNCEISGRDATRQGARSHPCWRNRRRSQGLCGLASVSADRVNGRCRFGRSWSLRAESAQAHFSRPAHATPATSANRQSGFTLGVSIRTGRPRAGLGRQPATARDGNRPLFRTGTCAQDVTLGSRRTACRGRRPFGQAPRQRIAILI
jgi:hypothetical protein